MVSGGIPNCIGPAEVIATQPPLGNSKTFPLMSLSLNNGESCVLWRIGHPGV